MEAVVSTIDLAEELGVTPETVGRWLREGRIEGAFRSRGKWRIPIEEAEAFAEEFGHPEEVEWAEESESDLRDTDEDSE